MVTVAAVLIGDEILSGEVEETNSRVLVETLRATGASLGRIVIIPDDPDEIAREVRHCSDAYEHVVTSGGVGPTHDDRTMEGVAKAFGRPIVRDPAIATIIKRILKDGANEAALTMADVPEGSHLIDAGAYPVVAYRNIYILPGIPEIFREKLGYLRERFSDAPTHVGRLFLGCYESVIATELAAISRERLGVTIGSYPRLSGEYRVQITVKSQDVAAVEHALELLRERLPAEHLLRVCPPEVSSKDDQAR